MGTIQDEAVAAAIREREIPGVKTNGQPMMVVRELRVEVTVKVFEATGRSTRGVSMGRAFHADPSQAGRQDSIDYIGQIARLAGAQAIAIHEEEV